MLAATDAGLVRDRLGEYTLAWYVAGALAIGAAALSLLLKRREPVPVEPEPMVATAPRAWRLRPSDG